MNGFLSAIRGFIKFVFFLVSIFSIFYVLYQNQEKILLFLQKHLPCCKRSTPCQNEFADYVD